MLLTIACICTLIVGTALEGGAEAEETMILYLHHSTGGVIWKGGVPEWLNQYNADHGTQYRALEQAFPKAEPYGWANYPYDYWNIWVENAGEEPYQEEPTLEMLTPEYDVIVFKHCYPVSNVGEDTGAGEIVSDAKRLENYYLQYEALKEKMRQFPQTRFIVWTGAALVEGKVSEANARRARQFFKWVRDEWDEPGDNIFVWDFYELETEGGLWLKPEYSSGPGNSHPSEAFARKAAPLFGQRLVDVLEGRGDSGKVTGAATSVENQSWSAVKEQAQP